MEQIAQIVANGVMAGCIYGLVAVSLALVFGVLDVPQFAFGAHAMIGGYITAVLAGDNYWLGLAVGMVVLALLGVMVQALVFDPLRNAPPAMLFIAAFGLLSVLQGLALIFFGPRVMTVKAPFEGTVSILGAQITYHRILVVAVAMLAVVFLNMFLRTTSLGRSIRASSQSRTGALVVGLSPRRIGIITMAIGSVLAGLAGGLLAPISQVYPTMGDSMILKAFVIIVLAGMGSINGALFGGLVVGLAESFGSAYISLEYRDVYPLLLLVLVLVVRPQGIFGRAERVA
ncbi:branched-chain amino acid ABC transporter permease [Nocardioides seonyuensis]|uniref:Branched-chain amino acid ABC transporter permease n=1 Tax=Nocardioides seonyuensis TaxID=2518371 RepID=A0A4P7IIS6_9ACTN|nr:branched-chain amino acid ABC transporter permease [Nocardioides seonyuensis]QBX57244.1 branched-chain amino acid ABC transporter permease [Nocardioides seonyuensis]